MSEMGKAAMTEVHAYVDGEMDEAARAAFEAKLGQDMPLQDALYRERRLREMLSGAYAPVLAEPMPDRLSALLKARGRTGAGPGSTAVGPACRQHHAGPQLHRQGRCLLPQLHLDRCPGQRRSGLPRGLAMAAAATGAFATG